MLSLGRMALEPAGDGLCAAKLYCVPRQMTIRWIRLLASEKIGIQPESLSGASDEVPVARAQERLNGTGRGDLRNTLRDVGTSLRATAEITQVFNRPTSS